MAVEESLRGGGLGQAVLDELERLAQRQGKSVIVLDAREAAVGFYRRNGYEAVGEGPVLFGEVRHSKMQKKFSVSMP